MGLFLWQTLFSMKVSAEWLFLQNQRGFASYFRRVFGLKIEHPKSTPRCPPPQGVARWVLPWAAQQSVNPHEWWVGRATFPHPVAGSTPGLPCPHEDSCISGPIFGPKSSSGTFGLCAEVRGTGLAQASSGICHTSAPCILLARAPFPPLHRHEV